MLRSITVLGLLLAFTACDGPPEETRASGVAALDDAIVELNTFIDDSLQIDQLGDGPGDANLFLGLDPTAPPPPQSESRDYPTGGPATFIDWEDLAGDIENHQVLDLDVGKTDPSSFPLSNECVGPSNVLAKMDLTYIASANNYEYAYLAVQRSANNGDAGYYWLFTKKVPHQILGGGPCSANKGHEQLLYDISGPDPDTGLGGDVLIAGHFKPSSDIPLLTVYRATATTDGVTAYDAIDFESGMWAIDPGGVAAVAVNTTRAAPGSFGADGVKSMDGPDLGAELFAEAAVPLSVFTQGSVCDASFYGSVITRSSGAGGTTPDLKDLAGPAYFNFGSAEAEAVLEPTCTLEADFRVTSATGADGQPITDPVCHWLFSDGTTSDLCSGTAAFAEAGSYGATLSVTDPASSCTATIEVAPVDLWAPIAVDADLTATCQSAFGYAATPSGGSPYGFDYSWTFTGGGTPTPASSTDASGSVGVSAGNVDYTGTVTITDRRYQEDGLVCTATDSDSARPYDPIVVSIAPSAEAGTCPTMETDAATYVPTLFGGTGVYSFVWSPLFCGTAATCTIDPDDSDYCYPLTAINVTVGDDSGLCEPATSETEYYEKATTLTWTDN